jgi:thiol-disulfide isomerase/thioredoxin
MSTGRALTLFLAIAGGLLLWSGARYAHRFGEPSASEASADAGDKADKATIRFFRNPTVVQAFAAADLDGRPISAGGLRGKVTIINFWATWCPPCRAEIPDLIALQNKYRDRLQIVGVSEDESPPAEVRQFVVQHAMNYPVVMATKEIEQRFPGVRALPTSFVLDRDGRVVQKHVGMLTAAMTELETRALAGLPVNASIEQVDQAQGLKLDASAQVMDIPGVELAPLPPARRVAALQKLNAESCTCGCDLTVAKCRVDDPSCGVSLPLARQIVRQIADQR